MENKTPDPGRNILVNPSASPFGGFLFTTLIIGVWVESTTTKQADTTYKAMARRAQTIRCGGVHSALRLSELTGNHPHTFQKVKERLLA